MSATTFQVAARCKRSKTCQLEAGFAEAVHGDGSNLVMGMAAAGWAAAGSEAAEAVAAGWEATAATAATAAPEAGLAAEGSEEEAVAEVAG